MEELQTKNTEETVEPTVKKTKKGKKTGLKILISILAVIIVFVGITTLITVSDVKKLNTLARSFEKVDCSWLDFNAYDNGCWNIYTDDEFKILQLTDVHIGGGWMSFKKDKMALNAAAAMITAEKPDFVIVTGDIAYPVPFQAGTFNNRSGAEIFGNLMESLDVYWTLTYGNHDTEAYSYFDREDISKLYGSEKYPHCLFHTGPDDVDGYGNQVFNIVNSDGVITRSLILLDSHSYIDSDKLGIKGDYDNIHENQIEWYKNTIKDLNAKNEKTFSTLTAEKATDYVNKFGTVPTSVYLHIPLTEFADAWAEYEEANGNTDNLTYNFGDLGESVCCGSNDDSFFETMLDTGSTDSVFCGHDHVNNFSITYKGIDLCYGMSIDYLAYIGISKQGSQRGCSVIHYTPDGKMTHESFNYYTDRYTPVFEKETVNME